MTTNSAWTPARIYNGYRVAIALVLLSLHYFPDKPQLGAYLPSLFSGTLWVYLGLTLVSTILDYRRALRRRPAWAQPLALILDLLMLTLVVHANGGLEGGLAVLLLVTVAAGNILLRGRLGYLIAALATLAMLFEQLHFTLRDDPGASIQLTEAGLLGVAFFMVSVIIQQIARRLDHSEHIARHQRVAIDRLEALNQQIVQRMRTGVIVFDQTQRILMSNESADQLYGQPMQGRHLPEQLIERHQRWLDNTGLPQEPFKASEQSPALSPRFAPLDTGHEQLTIVFLEDSARIAREAQQMNLASLGRLSATLAHEIRNPLSAINHATELLADGQQDPQDQRLLEIIRTHVARVNGIIHDVLDLSRRGQGSPASFKLTAFIDDFCQQWALRGGSQAPLKHHRNEQISVRFDPNQLTRVLDNLVGNAFRHGGENCTVELLYGRHERTGLPWLEVRDNGKGIDEDTARYLFEPFYTTASDGNGLGLYLCRELCQSNQATLEFLPRDNGTGFVITFAHPNRQFQ